MSDTKDINEIIKQELGFGILGVDGDSKNGPNWQDVPDHNKSNFLRERYWIEQWSHERWPCSDFVGGKGWTELRLADLGRRLDDPGDAFFDLFILSKLQSLVQVRTWVEVTEAFLSQDQAKKVNLFVREYNGLRGKGKIDARDFLRSLDLGLPDDQLQRVMADRVIDAVKKKAEKGRENGSYSDLVRDYGRGALIVGLPLWFSVLPPTPTDPSAVLDDFVCRLGLGFEAIQRSVLRTNWCPFDSIVVLWNPTLESADSWAKRADYGLYSDPANVTWQKPISASKMPVLAKIAYEGDKEHDLPVPSMKFHFRWDRYASIDAMLADHHKRFRLLNRTRPLGPKSPLKVTHLKDSTIRQKLLLRLKIWLLQVRMFIFLQGWRGLRRWIFARISPARIYDRYWHRWRIRNQLRKQYAREAANSK
ncbi:MAG: hypothetical protein F4X51_06545 [Gemmatimonadetes bacterium]|nr:hypothetical protein [Gemmatimonadota bacterium]